MRRLATVLAIALVAFASIVGLAAQRAGAGPSAAAATTKVTVVATDFKFKLSKTKVPKGTVVFTLVNKGKSSHDFKISGKKTPLVRPKKTAKLTVVFKEPGKYHYLCTVPGHALAGMKGVLTVTG